MQINVQPCEAIASGEKGWFSEGLKTTESFELGDEGTVAAARSALMVRFGGWAQLSSCQVTAHGPAASSPATSPGDAEVKDTDADRALAGASPVGGGAGSTAAAREEPLVGGCVVMDGGSEASFTGCTFADWAGPCILALFGGCVRLTNTSIKVGFSPRSHDCISF